MQEGFIFSDTIVSSNIAVGDDRPDPGRLRDAAATACIDSFVDSLPLGFDTRIGMEGCGVSQGQKQRILIARTVYKNPRYIFLDEATNALDANNERDIMANLGGFCRGKTVVIVPPPQHRAQCRQHRRARPRAHRRTGHPQQPHGAARTLLQPYQKPARTRQLMDQRHDDNRKTDWIDHCDEVRQTLDLLPRSVIWWSAALFAAITAAIAALLILTDAAAWISTLIPVPELSEADIRQACARIHSSLTQSLRYIMSAADHAAPTGRSVDLDHLYLEHESRSGRNVAYSLLP